MNVPRVLPVLLVAAFVPACRKPAVESYRVPKDTAAAAAAAEMTKGPAMAPAAMPPGAAPGAGIAGTAVATADGSALTWTVPAHWTSKAGSAMRKATYAIKAEGVPGEGELAVTAFPGDVGGDFANFNRWRGQLNLPAATQAEFQSAAQHVDRNDLHMTVVDISASGATANRLLGVMVPHAGATWFFKFTGPDALVAKEKAAFMAFVNTIKPAAAAK